MRQLAQHSEKLYYFFQVTLAGSLQAAGRKIGISAPTLSYSIKELEGVLKIKLFERSTKGMKLSDEGNKLKHFCIRYFSEMDTLTQEFISPEFKAKRKIKMGIFPTIAIYFWPLVLEHFDEDPTTSISIQTNRSHLLLESLIRREIDIAITVDTVKFDRMIKHELYQDHFAFYVCAKKWKREFNANVFKNEVLLYMPDAQDEQGKTLQQYVNGQSFVFKDHFELDSLEVICEFVRRGYGIGILPTRVAKNFSGTMKKIKVINSESIDFGYHRLYLTHRNDLDIPSRRIEQLINAAKKAVKQLNES